MAKGSFASDLKKTAAKNIGKSLARTGLIGGALGKAFAKRFGDDEEDTQVADALKEQSDAQDHNNATLERLESIVMNIADNVYNIAAVWSEHVTSMKEAQRHQREEEFKRQAQQEEDAAEALKISSPGAAATEGSEGEKKKSLFGNIIDAVGNTKGLMKGMLKKFALLALGVTAAVGATAALAYVGSQESEDVENTNVPSTTQLTNSSGSADTPSTSSSTSSSSTATTSSPSSTTSTSGGPATSMSTSGATSVNNAPTASAPGATPVSNAPVTSAPGATPVSSPPSIAATQEPVKLADVVKVPPDVKTNGISVVVPGGETKVFPDKETIDHWQQGKKTISVNVGGTNWTFKDAESFSKWQQEATPTQGQVATAPAATAPAGGAMAPSSGGGVGTSESSSGGGGAGGSESGGASPITPAASSGADVGAASVAVSAASESNKSDTQQIDISGDKKIEPPPAQAIPSPIADRGSLDNDTIFNLGST